MNKTFTASDGRIFNLDPTYRDRIVPRWRGMFAPWPPPTVSAEEVALAKQQVAALGDISGKDVLEVGCHGGLNCFALSAAGARSVVGMDLPAYGARQQYDVTEDMVRGRWKGLRLAAHEAFPDAPMPYFIEGDAEFAPIGVEQFDLIVSWQTLEHLVGWRGAASRWYQLLTPGGKAVHRWESFFSETGGHSLCTLDFPYGHCILSDKDVCRYIKEIRPQEKAVAVPFFLQSLNRLTVDDLSLWLNPSLWPDFACKSEVSVGMKRPPWTVSEIVKMYPSVTPEEVASTSIITTMEKLA